MVGRRALNPSPEVRQQAGGLRAPRAAPANVAMQSSEVSSEMVIIIIIILFFNKTLHCCIVLHELTHLLPLPDDVACVFSPRAPLRGRCAGWDLEGLSRRFVAVDGSAPQSSATDSSCASTFCFEHPGEQILVT